MKKILIITTAALMLAACSNKEEEMPGENQRVPVQFCASVGVTRAIDQTWSAIDAIGIYMIKARAAFKVENVSEKATNIRYIVDDAKASGFKPDGTTIYYPMDDSEVDFYAYYPQGVNTVTKDVISGNYMYAINVADQFNQEALDFMFSNNVKQRKKTNKQAALTFQHQLCKVILTIEAGEGVSDIDLTDLTVKVNNQNTTVTFDLTTGELQKNAAVAADIALFKQTGAYVYEAILLPTATITRIFEFNLNNGHDAPFTWDMDKALAGGSKYTYTVKLNRTGVDVSGSIDPWNSNNGGEVDAN